MRIQTVKFRSTYSDYHGYEYVQDGFKHFRNEKESVLAMHVYLMILEWNHGVYMHVNILEEVVPKHREVEGVIHWDPPFERKVHTVTVYDYPNARDNDAIRPTMEQALLMHALHEGELRGEFANRVANALYVDLVVLEPKSEFGKYLPEVKEFYDNLVAQGHWERKVK
jgi:hypothetical protein